MHGAELNAQVAENQTNPDRSSALSATSALKRLILAGPQSQRRAAQPLFPGGVREKGRSLSLEYAFKPAPSRAIEQEDREV